MDLAREGPTVGGYRKGGHDGPAQDTVLTGFRRRGGDGVH